MFKCVNDLARKLNTKLGGLSMKKVLSLVLSAAFMLTSSSAAFGSEAVETISKQEAKKDAIQYLNISKQVFDGWKNAKDLSIGNERTLYDFDGNINAYLFSVTNGTEGQGYIIESAIPSNPGLLQASISGDDPYKKGKVDSDKGIYVGNSSFYSKTDNNNFVELRTNNKIERKQLQNKGGRFSRETISKNSLTKSMPELSNISKTDVNALTSSYYILGGIGNIPYSIVGCVPIAEANILKYWASKSFPKLTQDATTGASMTDSQMTAELHSRMNTDSSGATQILMTAIGSKEYYTVRGYNRTVSSPLPNFNEYKLNLDNNKPVMVLVFDDHTPGYGLGNHNGYGDHALTGIGYQVTTTGTQYVVVFDGYESGAVVYPYNSNIHEMLIQNPY